MIAPTQTTDLTAGQVWKPKRGGMWRTIVAVHPAGVEWTAGPFIQPKAPAQPQPAEHAFSRWETWNEWVREALAVLLS